jgi:hypothetical protein
MSRNDFKFRPRARRPRHCPTRLSLSELSEDYCSWVLGPWKADTGPTGAVIRSTGKYDNSNDIDRRKLEQFPKYFLGRSRSDGSMSENGKALLENITD